MCLKIRLHLNDRGYVMFKIWNLTSLHCALWMNFLLFFKPYTKCKCYNIFCLCLIWGHLCRWVIKRYLNDIRILLLESIFYIFSVLTREWKARASIVTTWPCNTVKFMTEAASDVAFHWMLTFHVPCIFTVVIYVQLMLFFLILILVKIFWYFLW